MTHQPIVSFHTVSIPHSGAPDDALSIFYREAGDPTAPTLVLLHGFPTSSHMFRDLIPLLADKYHVIAPDLPGFGFSQAPDPTQFTYSFDALARVMASFVDTLGLARFALYVFDYGAPVGFRLAMAKPDQISALITQNGNAYEEGLSDGWTPMRAYWQDPSAANRENLRGFLKLETTHFQYTHGVSDAATRVAPESYTLDQHFLDRAGNDEIQLDLLGDYRTNIELYPAIQAYFQAHRPPTLAVWGRNDPFFLPAGAEAFRRDNPDTEVQFVDSGHFPLESHVPEIARHIRRFLARVLDERQGHALFGALTDASAPAAARATLDQMHGLFGFVPNLALAMAREPAALAAYVGMLGALGNTSLSPLEQQVVMAAASHANDATYGVAVHSALAGGRDVPAEIVAAIRSGGKIPDERLDVLRQFTTALAAGRTQVSDALVGRMTVVGFDAAAMVAVALGLASKAFANTVAHLARPEIDAQLQVASPAANAA